MRVKELSTQSGCDYLTAKHLLEVYFQLHSLAFEYPNHSPEKQRIEEIATQLVEPVEPVSILVAQQLLAVDEEKIDDFISCGLLETFDLNYLYLDKIAELYTFLREVSEHLKRA